LAKWIQERVTDLRSPDLFEEYQKNNHHSFYVRLDQPVPVDIVYDTVEIRDDELHIFQDVYYKINDQFQIVKEKLMEAGYNIKKIDLGFIQQQIQQSKNKEDLKFKITELLLSNRKKNMATGH